MNPVRFFFTSNVASFCRCTQSKRERKMVLLGPLGIQQRKKKINVLSSLVVLNWFLSRCHLKLLPDKANTANTFFCLLLLAKKIMPAPAFLHSKPHIFRFALTFTINLAMPKRVRPNESNETTSNFNKCILHIFWTGLLLEAFDSGLRFIGSQCFYFFKLCMCLFVYLFVFREPRSEPRKKKEKQISIFNK